MRKALLSTIVMALLLGAWSLPAAVAQSSNYTRPVGVVALAGYDELMGNVRLAGQLAGRPKLASGLEGMLAVVTQGRGLAGLDTQRPWGLVIHTDGSELGGYLFLPVDDLGEFREVLKPYLKQVEDLGDGVLKVTGKGLQQTVYVKHVKSGWLFACDKREGLAHTPDDPTLLLKNLHKQYDVAARLHLSGIPADHREQFLARIRQQAREDAKQRPGEDDLEYAIRTIVATKVRQLGLAVAEDLDTVTLGWTFDDDADEAQVELAVTAKRGTKTAETFGQWAQAKTAFAGFRLPDAILSSSVAVTCPGMGSADLDALFEAIRAKAFADINAKQQTAAQTNAAKELVDGLLEVVQETVASGKGDGAMSVLLAPRAATVVAGRFIADGAKLQATLERLVEAARQEDADLVNRVLTMDAEKVRGVRLHALSLPVPDDAKNRDQLLQLVGETLEVVVGVGQQSVYLAAGRDAMETLMKAIERSAAAGQQKVSPMELSVALGKVAGFAVETGQGPRRQRAAKALAALKDSAGKDHVRLRAVPVERGVKLRLELEQGVLKAIESIPRGAGGAEGP